jgi:RNA polymerase-binding transcription factor DksA
MEQAKIRQDLKAGKLTEAEARQKLTELQQNRAQPPTQQAELKAQSVRTPQPEVIVSLRSTHGDHSFNAVGDCINVNGQIKIHPDKLAELRTEHPESFAKLLKGTKALEEQGRNFSKLSKDDQRLLTDLSGSNAKSAQRLRFEYQTHQQVDGYLKEMGIERESIFHSMSDEQRTRVFDLVHERPRQPIKDPAQRTAKHLEEQQAIDYALSQKPQSPNEFVEQFQMYKAVLDGRREQLKSYQTATERITQEKYGKPFDKLTNRGQSLVWKEASQEVLGREIDGEKAFKREAYIDTVNMLAHQTILEKPMLQPRKRCKLLTKRLSVRL